MNLFYREAGQGTPLIILHGLFGSSDNWLSIAKTIAEHYKVYILDQRNHGQSHHTEIFDYEAMAEDLFAFIEKHDIEQPVILGHSMGGKAAMKFALKYPDRLRKLIVVDIAPKAYPVHHQKILAGLHSINLKEVRSRKDADEVLALHEPIKEVRQFLLKNLYRDSSGNFNWRINLPVISENIEHVGELIESSVPFTKPTLFVRGEHSTYIVENDFDAIKKLFPRAQIKTVYNAGHWIHAEQPAVFTKLLYEFI
ncbi:MAG: alpha/beta fold hydrolase [Bacteroidota bacterium]